MIGYPLDSHVTYGADGTPIWDRAVSSAALRKLTKKLFSDGVLPNPSTNLQVAAVSGIIVKILSGFALCNGCQKLQEVDLEIELPVSDATYDRIDTVVLRLDDNDDVRACDFMVIKGVAASTPQVPALTQSDSIWEIGLANIYRKANSTEVSNANITDTRYDTSRCGIISSISQFDTKTLYQQIEEDLDEFKTVNQAEFLAWFETIQNQLSGDIAGNLLTMINDIKEDIGSLENLKTKTQTSIIDAINELKNGLDNAKVDTLTTMEEVNASTDKTQPVGAGAIQELNSNLGGYALTTKDGKIAYYQVSEGADSAVPFISGGIYNVINLGNEREINITDIVGAEHIAEYTEDDFICEMIFAPINLTVHIDYYTNTNITLKQSPVKSYNPSTGILSITGAVFHVYTYVNDWTIVENADRDGNVITYLKLKTPPIE